MPLRIKNQEVERLATEIARLTGETKTEAIRRALDERRANLSFQVGRRDRGARFRRFLAAEAWPAVPKKELGRRLSKKEEEAILGYGPRGT